MPSKEAEILGLPPGVNFDPDDDELVEFYLLPCARGDPPASPSVFIDDDTAATTQPWKLFERHGLADDEGAYFYVHNTIGCGSDGKATSAYQQHRGCDGGGKWKSQKRVPCVGEEIKWSRHNLNLHMGSGGSTGWVMHEYTITDPPCPSLRICYIAFSGYGQKRRRVPNGSDDCQCQAASQRARVDDDRGCAAGSGSVTTAAAPAYGHQQQPLQQLVLPDLADIFPLSPLLNSSDEEPCQLGELGEQQQQQMVMMPPPMVQETDMAEAVHGDEDPEEFLASMGLTLESFCDCDVSDSDIGGFHLCH